MDYSSNQGIEFRLWGDNALFTDPVTKLGGEKSTYPVPTYEALKGVCESIYWKPTITWVIDKVRVMKRIRTESKNIKPLCYNGGNELSVYTYLSDVEYQVKAHFKFNMTRADLECDRNPNKHHQIALKSLEKGGRRDIFLGTRECQAYVQPCKFGSGEGFYDNDGNFSFGLVFHGFEYPSVTGGDIIEARLWSAEMADGVIDFIRPDRCIIRQEVRKAYAVNPAIGKEK